MTATQPRSEPPVPAYTDGISQPFGEGMEASSFDERNWTYVAEDAEPVSPGGRAVLGWALGLLAAAWLAFSAWSAGQALAARPLTAPELASWVAIAAGPLALLGLVWLMFGRTRRKEAEAFTRSVIAMRHEAQSLEGLLGVLRQRIDENHSSLKTIGNQLMGLGDEAAMRLGSASSELEGSARRITAQGEALDRAAEAARIDMGVLLEDLPRAEAVARSMAQVLQSTGAAALGQAAQFETQVGALSERTRDADQTIVAASQRLAAQLAEVEARTQAALAQINEATLESGSTIDALLQRSADALEEIRSGIDLQSQAVTALVDQSKAGIGQTGIDAADAISSKLQSAHTSLDGLAARVSAQEEASQRLIAGISGGLSALDEKFVALATDGDMRAATISDSLTRVRGELDAIAAQSGSHDGAMEGLAERMSGLRQSLDGLTADIQGQLTSALGDAEGGAQRLLDASEAAQPHIETSRDAAVEAATRLESGALAIEAQHDRLAALLVAVDTGVGGAERRLGDLSSAIAGAQAEAGQLSAETGPALVAALMQVREAANHAADRAREAIAAVIPGTAAQLSDAAQAALEKVISDTLIAQLAEVEQVTGRAVESARGASERLTQQMISIGQSAAALEQHFNDSNEAQRERDSERFARRVSLLIDSMHSASIDAGKILSDEVDDKAWSAYLKGDRGVFTRRAARLMGNAEARAIDAHYESDLEFQQSVNRYVHDFEAMLRRVTADRDGGAMAVTLMGSDMGKLYAALAQVAGGRR
ncbi:hypothetical protein [Sphingomonas sp.]|uniref:hypothetical protein n=1 Tax=Sphingomonas sp. TaxID=28214 RepID=UPI00286B8C93|nr:hypothetical protein [Sphingomonas sp.]